MAIKELSPQPNYALMAGQAIADIFKAKAAKEDQDKQLMQRLMMFGVQSKLSTEEMTKLAGMIGTPSVRDSLLKMVTSPEWSARAQRQVEAENLSTQAVQEDIETKKQYREKFIPAQIERMKESTRLSEEQLQIERDKLEQLGDQWEKNFTEMKKQHADELGIRKLALQQERELRITGYKVQMGIAKMDMDRDIAMAGMRLNASNAANQASAGANLFRLQELYEGARKNLMDPKNGLSDQNRQIQLNMLDFQFAQSMKDSGIPFNYNPISPEGRDKLHELFGTVGAFNLEMYKKFGSGVATRLIPQTLDQFIIPILQDKLPEGTLKNKAMDTITAASAELKDLGQNVDTRLAAQIQAVRDEVSRSALQGTFEGGIPMQRDPNTGELMPHYKTPQEEMASGTPPSVAFAKWENDYNTFQRQLDLGANSPELDTFLNPAAFNQQQQQSQTSPGNPVPGLFGVPGLGTSSPTMNTLANSIMPYLQKFSSGG